MKRKANFSMDDGGPTKRKRHNEHDCNRSNPIKTSTASSFFTANFDLDSEGIGRPSLPNSFTTSSALQFQHIDTEYYIGFDPLNNNRSDQRSKRAIIKLFGVTQSGESVLCHCVGFAPYFYCNTWPGFVKGRDEGKVRNALEQRLRSNDVANKFKCDVYVPRVVSEEKQSIWGYHFGSLKTVLKIYLSLPTVVTAARKSIIDGIRLPGHSEMFSSQTFESSMVFPLRFMIDQHIVGAGWVGVDAATYHIVPPRRQSSHCTLEVVARWDNVRGIAQMDDIAPLRILSFDIECMCGEGFPEATRQNDRVIQISNVCYVQGAEHRDDRADPDGEGEDVEMKDHDHGATKKKVKESKSPSPVQGDVYFHQNVFTLNTCAPIAGCNVYSFQTEKELLREWAKFFRQLDPDILTGYNIVNFDLPYLITRAEYLGITDFAYLGREKHKKSVIKESSFSSRAYGSSKSKDINIAGRVQMDLLPIIRRDHKLRSYSLNAVSFEFLKSQKEDVHYSDIAGLQEGNEQTRRRLAVYCLKDSILPLKLIKKLQTTINLIEMARVTGVPINFLITRGQQIKVLSQLYRECKPRNLIIPYMPYNREAGGSSEVGYEGATVIEPKRGYYTEPITTLDFASLYPSIMIAHNLCYTTMVEQQDIGRVDKSECTQIPGTNSFFVKSSKQKGVLPDILTKLLTERKKVKKAMKALAKEGKKETMEYAVFNGRQLALKISANSVYGFTGATVGALPCLTISGAVTSFGRDMIHATKEFVERHYSIKNGFACDADVVYGDTDSVMIKFGTTSEDTKVTMAQAMEYGKAAADLVTEKLFIPPIKLEFEKVYLPYLLMNKKRYAGMLWTNTEKWDYMDAKGIETVRRDNAPITKNLVQNVLNYVLIDADKDAAIAYTKNIISRLLQNKIDLSNLIISKKLNKIEDYKVRAAHVELVVKMRNRGDVKKYKTGDRVSYVIVKGRKGAKAYEKAEDPLYVLENKIAIDTEYYLKNQLQQPLTRIFEPIVGTKGVKSILNGDHTRTIKVTKTNMGAMFKFAVKKKTCIGCKCILKKADEKSSVCSKCKPKESQFYMKQMAVVRKKERSFHVLWTQCQRCQGSLTQEVLCSNRDCPIFYKRTKVKKDMEEAQKLLAQFSM